MFENEIKFISDFTLNKVKELGSFITIEKLLSTDIHPSIKKYVEGEINYLIYEDRKKLIENSLFDYSGKEIANYFDLISEEIKKTKKISYEDIKNIILQAVSFNANFVVRPKWSLSKLIFGNNKNVSVNEIQMMLNYTYYYEYLNNVFLGYLSKKKILSISNTEFELIVNKIDRELFMLHQSKLVDNALYAIADYFSIGGINRSSISVESVEIFLKEKNLTELLFKLKRAYSGNAKKKVDIDDLRKVLYSTLSIDYPFPENEKTQEATAGEEFFENPLKNEDDLLGDVDEKTEELSASVPQSQPIEESGSEDDLSTIIPEPNEILESTPESEENDILFEKALHQDAPNKFGFDIDENNSVDAPISESNATTENENIPLPDELNIPEEMEDEKQLLVSDENILAQLTDEIDDEKEDEIIILDDKEQENLLNFYDNELEISIDEEIPMIEDDEKELVINDLVENSEENELEIPMKETDDTSDEIPLEKIDFEKDLLGVDTSKENEDDDKLDARSIKQKRSDDIFSYLSRKEIDRIIKNLFNSDSEDFANTVERMCSCNTYEDATDILESIFRYARIKPHSKDASILSKAVAKYFNVDK